MQERQYSTSLAESGEGGYLTHQSLPVILSSPFEKAWSFMYALLKRIYCLFVLCLHEKLTATGFIISYFEMLLVYVFFDLLS